MYLFLQKDFDRFSCMFLNIKAIYFKDIGNKCLNIANNIEAPMNF